MFLFIAFFYIIATIYIKTILLTNSSNKFSMPVADHHVITFSRICLYEFLKQIFNCVKLSVTECLFTLEQ